MLIDKNKYKPTGGVNAPTTVAIEKSTPNISGSTPRLITNGYTIGSITAVAARVSIKHPITSIIPIIIRTTTVGFVETESIKVLMVSARFSLANI